MATAFAGPKAQRTKVNFPLGEKVAVRLEKLEAREVTNTGGTDFLYWLDGHRSMFVPAAAHDQIQKIGATDLYITRTRRNGSLAIDWLVLSAKANHLERAAVVAADRNQAGPVQSVDALGDLMRASLAAALRAVMESGEDVRSMDWKTQDLRALATTIFITASGRGGVDA